MKVTYRYTLHPHERERVDGYFRPGMHAGFLHERDDFGSWTVYREQSDFVEMRHYNGAVMRVVIADGRAMSYELFEGEAAQKLESEWNAFLATGEREGRQAAVLAERQYEPRNKRYEDQAVAGCTFAGDVLMSCGFVRCDLSGAMLEGVTVNECGFDGGSLRSARLARAIVRSSVFNGVDASGLLVDGARFEGCVFRRGALASITGQGATFARCRFEGTSFQNSRLVEAKLEQCKFEDCDFTGTDWTGIDATLAVFEGCCGGPGGKNDRNPATPKHPSFDAAAFVFAGDRTLRAEIDADESTRALVAEQRLPERTLLGRRLQFGAQVRLTRAMAPELNQLIDELLQTWGATFAVDVFVAQEPGIRAFVGGRHEDRVSLALSVSALEKLDEGELRFLIGHELGHVLLDHVSLAAPDADIKARLEPHAVLRWFAWLRYAELSADRIGLLSSGSLTSALSALFKVASGLSDDRYVRRAVDVVEQADAMAAISDTSVEVDWLQTHPYVPLRMRALQVFHASQRYLKSRGQSGGISDEALEESSRAVLEVMDPVVLQPKFQRRIQRFFHLATALVLVADGELDSDERLAVTKRLGTEAAELVSLAAQLPDQARKELRLAALELTLDCPPPVRHKLLEELCVYANVSGGVTDSERSMLVECARLLELPPAAVDAALTRHLDLD